MNTLSVFVVLKQGGALEIFPLRYFSPLIYVLINIIYNSGRGGGGY
jgi:hypothetical protein